MKKRFIYSFISFILIVSILCTSVFGADTGTYYPFNSIQLQLDYTDRSLSGYWVWVDPAEFLTYVVSAYQYNSAFEMYYDAAPAQIQQCSFYSNGNWYHGQVISFKTGTYYLNDTNIDYVDGMPAIDLTLSYPYFPNYYTISGVKFGSSPGLKAII